MTVEDAAGAGSWSIKGFDYQVDVSVWLALDLMVAARLTPEILLEHVSEEDVEADVEEFEPRSVVDGLPMREGYRLIVQAKRRSGDAWTPTSYLSLLEHGKRRKSALARLKADPGARYLLITSAAVNGPLKDLMVRKPGPWRNPSNLPAMIASAGENLGGRLAIVGNQDDERLERDIKELLLEQFRVPFARWPDCLTALRDAAWDRMKGVGNGRWLRREVEEIILAHDGYVLAASEADSFVPPTNWGDLVRALDTNHALMIVGQSGSGKTRAADALWRDRRDAIPGLARVHITHGPQQLLSDRTPSPVLYEIEDPWGRFKFEPNSLPWNAELSKAFDGAQHDRLIVATSRIDVARSSTAFDTTKRWQMSLDAENYGLAERRTLYRNLMKALPPHLHALAHERERNVLAELQLPLEIRKFFDALQAAEPDTRGKWPISRVDDAVRLAHRDSIEQTVMDQIESRDAVMPAAIVWALLGAAGRISGDVLRALLDPLADRQSELEDRLWAFVTSFIVGRNLRQGEDGSLTYYHPRVEAGIEAAVTKAPQRGRRALKALVEALIEKDINEGGTWGTDQAARIIENARDVPELRPVPDRASMDRLDAVLESRLRDDTEFESAVYTLAAVGSSRSNLAEFARWLTKRPRDANPMWTRWENTVMPASWYEQMRADPEVQAFADRFVRSLMCHGRIEYDAAFVAEIARVAPDLQDAFIEAASRVIHGGYNGSDDVAFAGALKSLDAFEKVVDEAIDLITPSDSELAETARARLMIINQEVSDDYAEVMLDNEYAQMAFDALRLYIKTLRRERGWRALQTHRHLAHLRSMWLQAIKDGEFGDAGGEEVVAVLKACLGTEDELAAWKFLLDHWHPQFKDALCIRLVNAGQDGDLLDTVFRCMIAHYPGDGETVIASLIATDARVELARLSRALAVAAIDLKWAREDFVLDITEIHGVLPDPFQALVAGLQALEQDRLPELDGSLPELLASIHDAPEDIRAMRLALAERTDLEVTPDVAWMLVHSDDLDNARLAMGVAVARSLTGIIEQHLDHRFAPVAAQAITAFGKPISAPLPQRLLDRCDRKGRPVRSAIACLIAQKPHVDHLPTLEILVRDTWTNWEQHGTDQANFATARLAGDAILNMSVVPDGFLDMLATLANETNDPHLMVQSLRAAVRFGDSARQLSVVERVAASRRLVVGQNAAFALFKEFNHLRSETVTAIAALDMLRLRAAIIDYLVVIVGALGSDQVVDALATSLNSSADRRVFLALLAWSRNFLDKGHAANIAAHLPEGHPARRWALGETVEVLRDDLRPLGDAASVKEAFGWMNRSEAKTGR